MYNVLWTKGNPHVLAHNYIQTLPVLAGSKVATSHPAVRNLITMKPVNTPQICIVRMRMCVGACVCTECMHMQMHPVQNVHHCCSSKQIFQLRSCAQ